MRVYVDIQHESCPSGRTFYSYQLEEVAPDFTAPARSFFIDPCPYNYEPGDIYISLEQEMEGFRYYRSDITFDIKDIKENLKPAFLTALKEQLSNGFHEKKLLKEELIALANQVQDKLIVEDKFNQVLSILKIPHHFQLTTRRREEGSPLAYFTLPIQLDSQIAKTYFYLIEAEFGSIVHYNAPTNQTAATIYLSSLSELENKLDRFLNKWEQGHAHVLRFFAPPQEQNDNHTLQIGAVEIRSGRH